jgi:hypothetical protein
MRATSRSRDAFTSNQALQLTAATHFRFLEFAVTQSGRRG